MSKYYFTSESVTEGHPDKICDQISDAVLDAVLKDDPEGACCCEVYTTTGLVVVGGEITTKTYVDIQKIVRDTLKEIGYDNADYGIDYKSCGDKVTRLLFQPSTGREKNRVLLFQTAQDHLKDSRTIDFSNTISGIVLLCWIHQVGICAHLLFRN